MKKPFKNSMVVWMILLMFLCLGMSIDIIYIMVENNDYALLGVVILYLSTMIFIYVSVLHKQFRYFIIKYYI